MKKRNQSLDILRGIGILLMVFDHVNWGYAVHIYVNFRSAVPKKELMKRSVTFELPIKSPFFTVA
jgi:uncharacterized membrane protein